MPIERFTKLFRITEAGCWQWTGHLDIGGYGSFWNGKPIKAHRFSYEYYIGVIPEGLELDHLCRNRACVNPAHLEPTTRKINESRAIQNPHNKLKTHCPAGHPYDIINTRFDKNGNRECKICSRMRVDKYRAKPETRLKKTNYMRKYRQRLAESGI